MALGLKKVKPEKFDKPLKEFRQMVHFDENELPELKDWEVGRDYHIVLKVRQMSKEQHMGDSKMKGKFEIMGVKAMGNGKAMTKKQQEVMDAMSDPE